MSNREQLLGVIGWLCVCFATAATGAAASMQAKSFYAQLVQPSWAPAPWLFGPVWTCLYLMMAIAVWLVWRAGGVRPNRIALSLCVLQLVLNGLWSWLFFAWAQGVFALIEILLLWVLILVNSVAFWRVSRFAGALLIPYLVWVGFASALTYSLWRLNPGLLGD
mgnify:CR=1 FL=1